MDIDGGVGVDLRMGRAARLDVVCKAVTQAAQGGDHHAVMPQLNIGQRRQRCFTRIKRILYASCQQPVINRIKPKVDGLLGMEKTQRTTAKCFPRTPKHEHDADAATESIRFVLQDNFYNEQRSNAFDDILVPGTGGFDITVKDAKDGFKIVIKAVPWDRIIYDPHSRRKDFSDARYKGMVVWMDYDEAIELYPDAESVLEDMQTGSDTYDDKPRWMDNARRRVKIVHLYYYKGKEV